MQNKYTWEYSDNAEVWTHDYFDTEEECVEDAKGNYDVEDSICVGEVEKVSINADLDDVLERVMEDVYEQVGEVSEGWDISSNKDRKEIYEKYEEKLNQLVKDYIKEIDEEPKFYSIVNEHEVKIGD